MAQVTKVLIHTKIFRLFFYRKMSFTTSFKRVSRIYPLKKVKGSREKSIYPLKKTKGIPAFRTYPLKKVIGRPAKSIYLLKKVKGIPADRDFLRKINANRRDNIHPAPNAMRVINSRGFNPRCGWVLFRSRGRETAGLYII